MILISIIITILYLVLIGCFSFGFDKIKNFMLEDLISKTKFSIIIPFRNEAKNLPDLLKSIKSLNYPKHLFEVILVDDMSEDNSVKLIKECKLNMKNISILSNKKQTTSPKKECITLGINQAKFEWIITTDADCVLPKYWLDSYDELIQKTNPKCVVAPVSFKETGTFLNRFQILDLLSLQGATIGGFGIKKPFLCNGANLAYTKALFLQVNGFEGNTNIASGDDIFLLEKVLKTHPQELHYLKSEHAIIKTNSQQSWKALTSQRVRWAAKTSSYNNWFGKLTGLIVLLMNAVIITDLLLLIFAVFNFKIWLYILVIKFSIDFLLIYKSSIFFNQKGVLISFLFAFILYPFFSAYVAVISMFSNYQWKGREFKK
ncbi:MAG: glycosyltransferase [Flaviramulus sp.]|nr:glycosyltransferase [Flaviramulus sp.]